MPRGSNYPIFEVPGSNIHSRYGFWSQEPPIFGVLGPSGVYTWVLKGLPYHDFRAYMYVPYSYMEPLGNLCSYRPLERRQGEPRQPNKP